MMDFYLHWQPVIVITLINVMLTCGLYVTALSGQLSLATAAIAGIGGYIAAVLTTNFGWPFLPATAIAVLAGALVGTFVAAVTVKMREFILKLTTLAFGEAVAVLAFNIDYIGGANSFTGIPFYSSIWVVIGGTAIAIYLAWRFDGSRLGFAARAVRDDPLAASAMGVSILWTRIVTFALGGAIVGAGGSIQAHYLLILNPHELGFFISLTYIIFLLVGGMQSLWGPLLAAVVLTALPEISRFLADYRMILYGFVIVLVVLFRPEGLLTRAPTRTASRRPAGPPPGRTQAARARSL
jgi:branched-chain amino acid transport system permease protein